MGVEENYKEFLNVVPEDKKNLAIEGLGIEESKRRYREGIFENPVYEHLLDSNK